MTVSQRQQKLQHGHGLSRQVVGAVQVRTLLHQQQLFGMVCGVCVVLCVVCYVLCGVCVSVRERRLIGSSMVRVTPSRMATLEVRRVGLKAVHIPISFAPLAQTPEKSDQKKENNKKERSPTLYLLILVWVSLPSSEAWVQKATAAARHARAAASSPVASSRCTSVATTAGRWHRGLPSCCRASMAAAGWCCSSRICALASLLCVQADGCCWMYSCWCWWR